MRVIAALTFCVAGLVAATAQADWGDLTMTFVYGGSAPKAEKVVPTKDAQFCGKFELMDESLVVNPKNKGIANVVVFIFRPTGLKVHPELAAAAKKPVILDNQGCRFEPHIRTLQVGQTLKIKNSDEVGHNTKIDVVINNPINPIIPAKQELDHVFTTGEESLPMPVSCNIHPWMTAKVLIKDNPYMAVSDADGKLTIPKLPEGEWDFRVWHETAGYLDKAKQGSKSISWRRGRMTTKIKSGKNDLGSFTIAPSAFEK